MFDAVPNQRLSAPFRGDANDHLYQWESSRDCNPAPGLERIRATLLAINSADDERTPPELGVLDREIKRVKRPRALAEGARGRWHRRCGLSFTQSRREGSASSRRHLQGYRGARQGGHRA
jgi:homoserine O-acetyltransferase/O-succinyltransferase